jgi:hypothetical protein
VNAVFRCENLNEGDHIEDRGVERDGDNIKVYHIEIEWEGMD